MCSRYHLYGRKWRTKEPLDESERQWKFGLKKSYGFFSSHVWMWVLDYKESRSLKNWYFCTVVFKKFSEIPLDCKENHPVHPKGNQSWIIFWRTVAEAETPILKPSDAKNWLIGKDPDARRVKVGGEWDHREWDGSITSPTWWTWVWVSSGRWWWTGKPGILQSIGSQRVRYGWVTELNWVSPEEPYFSSRYNQTMVVFISIS